MITTLFTDFGIHVSKQKSSMADIQFTDPCKKRKLLDCEDDDCSSSSTVSLWSKGEQKEMTYEALKSHPASTKQKERE